MCHPSPRTRAGRASRLAAVATTLVTATVVGVAPLALSACGDAQPRTAPRDVKLAYQTAATGLASPVYLTAPSGDSRLFIVEQGGRIRIVKNGQLLATPFLDIASKVRAGGEQGLLSVAFDPAFATNGRFYVYYNAAGAGTITIERYTAASGADVADATGTPVLTIPHPTYTNHNGGLVAFGPDGMLYIGTGDGGGGGDPDHNAQNLNVLLGKLLRIDVRTLPYAIPASNPFAGQSGKRGEIWAYGLRNPWRWMFDSATGSLWIADVGQDAWEEVDVVSATTGGVNYGWNTMEGTHCYPSGSTCSTAGLQAPIYEYDHSHGCSITGGFVYHGTAIPEVAGQYFYSDYCTGFLASLTHSGSTTTSKDWGLAKPGNVLSFGRDAAGELYVLTAGGDVLKIVAQ